MKQAGLLISAVILINSSAVGGDTRPAPTAERFDSFDEQTLAGFWLFEDPNRNDTYSLSARKGWLQCRLTSADEDVWSDDRGGAPFLLGHKQESNVDFSVETHVDLAVSNGGYPVLNSIGGLIVCDAQDTTADSPFELTLGLQHSWTAGTEVIVQKPGHNVQWASPESNAAHLRLVRRAKAGTWTSYFRNHSAAEWTLLAAVKDSDLPEGKAPETVELGLFAKTWDPQVGGPAHVDFAYFGTCTTISREWETPESIDAKPSRQETDLSSLETFCVSGKERSVLNRYREAELLRRTGKGCLTHMWFGGNWSGYEQTRIRIYVDGEREPSIDMELGLGHGYGFGDDAAPWGSGKLGKTGHPSGVYNTYRIPYGDGVRVTAQRCEDSPDGAPFWWIVRGTTNLPATISGVRLPDSARLKLHKLEGHTAQPFEEFSLTEVTGAGALYQVTMAADGQRDSGDWKDISYLEAIVRAYLNGSKRAVELSSGLEDYFLGTYYFNRGRYANELAGLTHLDTKKNTFSAYRFHDEDPVFFQRGFRLTCRCGEEIGGRKLHDPPKTLFTTYTWLYQW